MQASSVKQKDRVMEAVEKLGYRLNGAVRAARTGKTGNLGMLLSIDPKHSRLHSDLIRPVYE